MISFNLFSADSVFNGTVSSNFGTLPVSKKTVAVALIVFAVLAICYFIYSQCFKKITLGNASGIDDDQKALKERIAEKKMLSPAIKIDEKMMLVHQFPDPSISFVRTIDAPNGSVEISIMRLDGTDYKIITSNVDDSKITSLVDLIGKLTFQERSLIPKNLKLISVDKISAPPFRELKKEVYQIGSHSTDDATKTFFTDFIREEERKSTEEDERRQLEYKQLKAKQYAKDQLLLSQDYSPYFLTDAELFKNPPETLTLGEGPEIYLRALCDVNHPYHAFSVKLLKLAIDWSNSLKGMDLEQFHSEHSQEFGHWPRMVAYWIERDRLPQAIVDAHS